MGMAGKPAKEAVMATIQKVFDFLNEAGFFTLATADGSQAKCRPLGFKMLKDGRICFGVGTHKAVYRELKANAKCEITACVAPAWIRITGEAVFIDDPAYQTEAREVLPMLKDAYNEKTGLSLGIFTIKGRAAFMNIMGGEDDSVEL